MLHTYSGFDVLDPSVWVGRELRFSSDSDWEDYEIVDPRSGQVTEDKPLASRLSRLAFCGPASPG